MNVWPLKPDDVNWSVRALASRRARIRQHAPVFWNPAPAASQVHGEFLNYLLTEGGARGWRTERSVLIAAPGRWGGWSVDDAHVVDNQWQDGDGLLLWEALRSSAPGQAVRFTCPVYEVERNEFALSRGLNLSSTWWLREIGEPHGLQPEGGDGPQLVGAEAVYVEAPPVYAPGGPMLLLRHTNDPSSVEQGLDLALSTGCAGLVVDVPPDSSLGPVLESAELRPHCNFYDGTL